MTEYIYQSLIEYNLFSFGFGIDFSCMLMRIDSSSILEYSSFGLQNEQPGLGSGSFLGMNHSSLFQIQYLG